jgi:nucleotide-binding universal stress UspA family protein
VYHKILLPVDLTAKHGPALEAAAEFARQSGGTVTLLHVIELIPGLSLEEERGFYQRLERDARAHLQRLGGHLAGRVSAWQAEVLFGRRAAETVRYAVQAAIDLIIVTSPRIDPGNPMIEWTSMSYNICFLSQCPVLMIK